MEALSVALWAAQTNRRVPGRKAKAPVAEPPTVSPLKRQKWEKPHQPNLTGTVRAYHPKGSLARGGVRAASASGDYQAWKPDAGDAS